MGRFLVVLIVVAALAGCHDAAPPTVAAKPLNPGGAPRDTKEAEMMTAHAQAGDRANATMAKAAQAIAAAKARNGQK